MEIANHPFGMFLSLEDDWTLDMSSASAHKWNMLEWVPTCVTTNTNTAQLQILYKYKYWTNTNNTQIQL